MITVLFRTESHYPVSRKKVKDAVISALSGKIRSRAEVSISIVGDRKMRSLNKKYRKLDKTTDVLSFGFNDPTSPARPFAEPPDHVLRLGDIIISYPQAMRQASEKETLVDEAIVELALHGLDHLLGIHHEE